MGENKTLKFSEYRIEYAREIRETLLKDRYEQLEELVMRMYSDYLSICGYKDLASEISDLITKVLKVIHDKEKAALTSPAYKGTCYKTNEEYDEEFVNNINQEIDKLVEQHLKK